MNKFMYIPLLIIATLLLGCVDDGSNKQSDTGTINAAEQAWVTAHNQYRKLHAAPNLQWSADLAQRAQKHVNKCSFNHSTTEELNNKRGENLYISTIDSLAEYVVKNWYDEIQNYSFTTGNKKAGVTSSSYAQGQIGHFTQVVWKATTHVGCAVKNDCNYSQNDYNFSYHVTCQYSPAGNITNDGYHQQNVLPKQ